MGSMLIELMHLFAVINWIEILNHCNKNMIQSKNGEEWYRHSAKSHDWPMIGIKLGANQPGWILVNYIYSHTGSPFPSTDIQN